MKRLTIFLFLFTLISFVGPIKAKADTAFTLNDLGSEQFYKLCLNSLSSSSYALDKLDQTLTLENLDTLIILLKDHTEYTAHNYSLFNFRNPSSPLINQKEILNLELINFLIEVQSNFKNLKMKKSRAHCFTIEPKVGTDSNT